MCHRFQKSRNEEAEKGRSKFSGKAHAHQPRQGNHDVDVAGKIRIKKEWVNDGQSEGGKKLERERQRLRHLRQRVFTARISNSIASTLTLKKPRMMRSNCKPITRGPSAIGSAANWSRGELVVALDGAGDERGEVQRVEQICAQSDVPLLVSIPRFDQQVEYAKEDV